MISRKNKGTTNITSNITSTTNNTTSTMAVVDWLDAQGRLLYGKYKGKTLETVVLLDHAYIQWIVNNIEDISDGDRAIMQSQLSYKGR